MLRTLCLDKSEGAIRRRPLPSPLQSLLSTRELKLDTWLALEAIEHLSHTGSDSDDLSEAVVFYLHLSTDGTGEPPDAPAFTTVKELVSEQTGRPAN